MLEYRLVQLSLFYFLKDKLDTASWGSNGYGNGDVVTLMQSYPNDDQLNKIVVPSDSTAGLEHTITLPIVAVELVDQTATSFEIGSPSRQSRRALITVMATDEAEGQDLSQQIYEWLNFEAYVPLNNYNQGFTSTPEVGKIFIAGLRMTPVRIVGSPDLADRHRFEIEFTADTFNIDVSSTAYPTA